MRILIVTHGYPPHRVAGVERLSEHTALALAGSGHDVTVFTRRASQAPPIPRLERTNARGVSVVMISGGGWLQGRFPRHALTLDRLFERTLLEVEPDVVLISHLLNHSPSYVSIAHRWGIPAVLELHDFYVSCERVSLERLSGEPCGGPEGGRACATHCFPDDNQTLQRWSLRTRLFRHALEQADALICPSRFVADYVRETFGRQLPPLHVIGSGVDAAGGRQISARRRDGALHLGCIGAVVSFKGVHVVLEALRLARLTQVRLTVFGFVIQPYFGEQLRAAEAIDGLEFRAYGRFEPAELPVLLGDVDAVIVPSTEYETYSTVAHEAMALGMPVIASRIGALPEVIRHGENGLLFETGSAAELAAILQSLDNDRDRLSALRDGIQPTDWISVEERTQWLLALLDDVVGSEERTTAVTAGSQELSSLRDAFLEASPTI
jgi:glycosyltransferase involved in cell wall biosynthesis